MLESWLIVSKLVLFVSIGTLPVYHMMGFSLGKYHSVLIYRFVEELITYYKSRKASILAVELSSLIYIHLSTHRACIGLNTL